MNTQKIASITLVAVSVSFVLVILIFGSRPATAPAEKTTSETPVEGHGAAAQNEQKTFPPATEDSVLEEGLPLVHEIVYTEKGFAPGVLRIKPGSTVVFKNDSGDAFWPASSEHPTHEGLPGFDAGEPIPSGGTYEFTFKEAGIWGFHDHLSPSYLGVVVVE